MLVSGWQFQWLDNLNCQNTFLEFDALIVLSIIQPFLYEVYQLSYRWTDCTRLFIFAKSVIVKLLLHMYFQYHCSSFLDIRVTSNGVDISKRLPLYLKSILLRKITSPTTSYPFWKEWQLNVFDCPSNGWGMKFFSKLSRQFQKHTCLFFFLFFCSKIYTTRSAIGQCPIIHSCFLPYFRDLNYYQPKAES